MALLTGRRLGGTGGGGTATKRGCGRATGAGAGTGAAGALLPWVAPPLLPCAAPELSLSKRMCVLLAVELTVSVDPLRGRGRVPTTLCRPVVDRGLSRRYQQKRLQTYLLQGGKTITDLSESELFFWCR